MKKDVNFKQRTPAVWTNDRRANLTKTIDIIAISVCVFYVVFDYLNGAYDYMPFYLILFTGASLSLALLKFKLRTLAKISLLSSGLIMITIFSAWEATGSGIFMYFLVVSTGAITLFGPQEKWSAFSIGFFSLILFYIVNYTDLIQLDQLSLSEDYIKNSLLLNYIICLAATMTMVYYVLTIGQRYEDQVKETEGDLILLANQLEESKQKFELAIRGSSAGIWDWNLRDNTMYISPQMMKMLGDEENERVDVPYEKFINFVYEEDVKKVIQKLEGHLKRKENFEIECRLKKKNGNLIWVLNTGQAEWDRKGNELRMVGSIVDITERKNAEQELAKKNDMLKKANEELDSFVYSTSHDLRAPLSSVVGLVNLAQTTDDPQEIQKCLDLMKKRVDVLNDFISEITDYSRNTRLEVASDRIVLDSTIQEICDSLEFFEKMKAIRFEKNFDLDFVFISDKSRLKIILNNLVTNAVKYHDLQKEDPYIIVHATKSTRNIEITVEDNGQGIDAEFQKEVFNMFYRASENSEGSGLGLYIAKEMIEKLGGTISLVSTPGLGSSFTIKLPVK